MAITKRYSPSRARPPTPKAPAAITFINSNKAALVTGAADIAAALGWEEKPAVKKAVQQELFSQLPEDERVLVNLLREKETVHIDELNTTTGLSSGLLSAALLSLEMQNIVRFPAGQTVQVIDRGDSAGLGRPPEGRFATALLKRPP